MAERIILKQRPNKTVYREGTVVIKEYVPSHPKDAVFSEAYIHSCVESSGLSIPKILSVVPQDGGWALSMEYIEGRTLAQMMEEHPEEEEEDLERLVEIQLEVGSCRVPRLRNTRSKMAEIIKSMEELDKSTRYELLVRIHGMKQHTKLCHGDFVPENVIIREDGSYCVLDWTHATSGNAGADAAITYMRFCLSQPEYADEYLRIFCEKSGMSLNYVQTWMPVVAAVQLSKHKESEEELLSQWIQVAEYQ